MVARFLDENQKHDARINGKFQTERKESTDNFTKDKSRFYKDGKTEQKDKNLEKKTLKKMKCYICGKNHFASQCDQKKHKNKELQLQNHIIENKTDTRPFIEVIIQEYKIRALVDSGSSDTFISKGIAEKINLVSNQLILSQN